MPPNGARRKRSHSVPAANSETSGIAAFFSRRLSGGGMSSANAAKGRKRKGSLMQPIQEELDHFREILPIPFEKPKPRYRNDFPRPEVFPEETWRERVIRVLREGARRIVSFFQD
ncbi:hypothetical protein CDAR_283321 [Caerostris darwini]|uniref:Uncharacterized protein n=1 Tax=Caerostris darwini TaxID=1538125 RepID=A0AAV4UEG5_9ARAC|nr:hypothetical protein CDAR_283321 [Caerostris darwini]